MTKRIHAFFRKCGTGKRELRLPLLALVIIFAVFTAPGCLAQESSADTGTETVSARETAEMPGANGDISTESTGTVRGNSVTAGIEEISEHGNVILDVSAAEMEALGYAPGDVILVSIAGQDLKMPIGTNYGDVDIGEYVCRFEYEEDDVILAICYDDLGAALGLTGETGDIPVVISMEEKQGYARQYALRQVPAERTNNREDYPQLTDEEYTNFRVVETTGMGKNALYRSSSPINPKNNRNREADEAVKQHGIRTVINTADSRKEMEAYPGFTETYYAGLDIKGLNMGMRFHTKTFRKKLTKGFRYMISHEGPYLVHCTEGKDRTGIVCALLECLMGADGEDIIRDYMITYYNFYGVEPGTEVYEVISSANIERTLEEMFGMDSIRDQGSLEEPAEKYLISAGMTEEEVGQLKEKLAADY